MAGTPGTFRFPEINATPAAPPVGYALVYIKTDNVLYLQDSNGTEISLGSASAITELNGDVLASGPGIAAATVAFVGGSSAANVHAAELAANAATSTNTSLRIVKRDSSGNFSANQITADLIGNASSATTSISFTGSLVGDVSGTQGATEVDFVGGSTASNVHLAELAANAATPSNTASTIVKRDASGNFTANLITANLSGNATTATSSGSFSGSLLGDVTGTQGATVVSFVGTSSAANVHSAELLANAATSINTAGTIVRRDNSGNFIANQITADLIGNVTGNLTGNVTGNVTGSAGSFTGPLVGDVSGTQGATEVDFVGGSSAANVHLAELLANAATSINTANAIVRRDSSGNFNAGTITASLNGNANTATTSVNFTGSLSGNVTGTQSSTVVASVGGSTAANIHSAELLANASTDADTPSTIVRRDGSGNFSAGTITAALSGNATTATSAGSFSGNLVGDVTGTQGATVVSFVGGSSAANVHTAELAANAATSANTPLTIVQRDASGNFIAGTITAALTGLVNGVDAAAHASRHLPAGADPLTTAAPLANLTSTTTNATGTANSLARSDHSHAITTDLAVTQTPDQSNSAGTAVGLAKADHIHNIPSGMPVQIGTSNFQGSAASFALSDHVHAHGNQTSGTLHAVATGSVNGFMSAADKTKLDASTSANTISTLVMRDASGNFSAGTITANLTGNVTGNVTGSAGSFTGSLVGDVTGTQGATVVSFVGTSSAANIHSAELLANAATNANTASTIVKRDASGNFSAGTITASLTGAASLNLLKSGDSMTGYFRSAIVALTDGATINTDVSLGNNFTVTLGGNRTLANPTGMSTSRQKATWIIKQDGTGGRTLTFGSAFNFGIDLSGISLSTPAGATDYIGAMYNPDTSKWDVIAITRGY